MENMLKKDATKAIYLKGLVLSAAPDIVRAGRSAETALAAIALGARVEAGLINDITCLARSLAGNAVDLMYATALAGDLGRALVDLRVLRTRVNVRLGIIEDALRTELELEQRVRNVIEQFGPTTDPVVVYERRVSVMYRKGEDDGNSDKVDVRITAAGTTRVSSTTSRHGNCWTRFFPDDVKFKELLDALANAFHPSADGPSTEPVESWEIHTP